VKVWGPLPGRRIRERAWPAVPYRVTGGGGPLWCRPDRGSGHRGGIARRIDGFPAWSFRHRNDLSGKVFTVPGMTVLNAVQAGRYLGVAERTIRNMINRGELSVLSTDPVRLDSAHVADILQARQVDALADLARRKQDPVCLARETRRVLHPRDLGANLPQDRAEAERRRLSLVSDTARLLFGNAALTAACSGDGCRWCRAQDFAKVLGGWAPAEYSEGFAALFGQEPCEKCAPGLYAPLWASLRSRVHPDGTGLSERAPRPSAGEQAMARQWVEQRAVTAASRPSVGDDKGKGLVQRRLRETRARLAAAKRSGDQRYAIRLRAIVASLEADAAAVTPRAAAAAGRPGRLRCGHALSEGCACPRRASARGRS
jgi:hypothetical protein